MQILGIICDIAKVWSVSVGLSISHCSVHNQVCQSGRVTENKFEESMVERGEGKSTNLAELWRNINVGVYQSHSLCLIKSPTL